MPIIYMVVEHMLGIRLVVATREMIAIAVGNILG